MLTCPHCQNVCDDSARFCPRCATPLRQVPGASAGQPSPQQVAPAGAQPGLAPQASAYGQPAQQAPYGQPAPTAPSPAGASTVQPVAPAPFAGGPVGVVPPGPGPVAQPSAGLVGAPQRSAIPAGFGLQQGPHAVPSGMPVPPVLPKRRGLSLLRFIPFALGPIIMVGVFGVMLFKGGSCSSVEGKFVSTGKPLGDFVFEPKQCRSGERMDFHGVTLLGKGPMSGAIMVIRDAVKGPLVKVEVPGSCQPPDYEVCTEVTIDKSECSTYKMRIERTNTSVNDIRLIDGSLDLDCNFHEGGTVKAKLDFDSCD